MTPDEHRAEAERILRRVKDHVDEYGRSLNSQEECDFNVARAHVHALLALTESAHRFAIRMRMTLDQAQRLIESERADAS